VDRSRLLKTLITVAALALVALPAVVAFGLGWLSFGHPDVPNGGATPPDTTPLEAWALFAVLYFIWLFGLMLLVVWSFDRVGHHWHAWDRAPRREKKKRRRLNAGVGFLAGQDKARADAEAELARRRAALEDTRRRASRGASGARPSDRSTTSRRPEDR
jgi:hypothetical protein